MSIKAKASRAITLLLTASVLFTSCVSTTMIQSTPSGAAVYINGESIGRTPVPYSDSKVMGSTNSIRLEKEGYEPFYTTFSRDEEVDVGAVIGGFCFFIPFAWAMRYKSVHAYQLRSFTEGGLPEGKNPSQGQAKSKADRLRELKQLYDEKLITEQEYERGKTKILEE